MSKHNGWSDFETWKVNLEVFDGMTPEDISGGETVTADDLQEYVEEIIYNSGNAHDVVRGFAFAFVCDVNWQEIADAINEAGAES